MRFLTKIHKPFTQLTLFLAFIAIIPLQAQWERVQAPTAYNLRKLSFVSATTGWAVGDSGTIIKTTDAGRSWVKQTTPLRDNLHDVSFADSLHGFAISVNFNIFPFVTQIHKTTNGGNTWTVSAYPQTDVFFLAVCFTDSLTGFLAGMEGALMRTTDGGNEWRQATIDSLAFSGFPILDVKFTDRQNGFACGGHIDIAGVMWRTTNGGENWGVMGVGPEPIHGFHTFSRNHIIAAGGDFEYGTGIVRSTDAGLTWAYRSLALYGVGQTAAFRTLREGWIPLGYDTRFLYTADSGTTWTQVLTPGKAAVYDMIFIDSTHGYAACDTGIVMRYNPVPDGISESTPGNHASAPELRVYPNPGNGTAAITAARAVTGPVKVFNMLGQQVLALNAEGASVLRLAAGALPDGAYIITAPGFSPVKYLKRSGGQ